MTKKESAIQKGGKNNKKTAPKRTPEKNSALCVERGEFLCKLRFLVRGVVLVQDPLGDGGIDGRHGDGVEGVRLLLIACGNGCKKLLDLSFQSGFDRLVLFGLLLGDKYAFFCGFDVRHGRYTP